MQKFRTFYYCFWLGLLSACTTHPKPTTPQVTSLSHFPSSNHQYQPIQNLPELAWWKAFHDPYLDRYLTQSVHNNLEIQSALARLEKSKNELQQIQLSWLPSLQILAGYSTYPGFGIPNGFVGAWPYYLVNVLQLYQREKQATYRVKYYQALEDSVRLTVIGQTTQAYFTLIAQENEQLLLSELISDLKKLVSYYQKDIHIGLKNNIDVANLLTTLHQIEAQLAITNHNITLSQNALHYLLNENPGQIQTSKQHFATMNLYQFKPGSLPATVLKNRPDFNMARYALKQSAKQVDIASANFFPAIQLEQFIGSQHLPKGELADFTNAYGVENIQLSNFALIESEKNSYQVEKLNYIQTIRKILKEVDNDFSANRQTTQYYTQTFDAQTTFLKKYDLELGLVKTGLLSQQALLAEKIELDKLKLLTNQAKLNMASSLVQLYQDLGGGYRAKAQK